jgi:hypothetical protein
MFMIGSSPRVLVRLRMQVGEIGNTSTMITGRPFDGISPEIRRRPGVIMIRIDDGPSPRREWVDSIYQ